MPSVPLGVLINNSSSRFPKTPWSEPSTISANWFAIILILLKGLIRKTSSLALSTACFAPD